MCRWGWQYASSEKFQWMSQDGLLCRRSLKGLTVLDLVWFLISATLPTLPAVTVALVTNTDVIIEAKQFLVIRFYFYHVD